MESPINRKAPGALEFGETFKVSGVTETGYTDGCIVFFDVFGSYVEVDVYRDGGEVTAEIYNTDRNFGKKQERFVKMMAIFICGITCGWFPEKMEPHLPEQLQ